MSRPLWQVDLFRRSHPTPFTARLTRIPFLGKLAKRLLFEDDDIVFVPINESIDPEENIALPSDVVRHFVKVAGHRWIMNECICRAAKKCEDHPIELGCIFLGEAVLGINPALGRLASVEETLEHVDKCEEAGLVHLIGRNKLDSVWLNVKPADKLLTICNCCNCCCLWKILLPNASSIDRRKCAQARGPRSGRLRCVRRLRNVQRNLLQPVDHHTKRKSGYLGYVYRLRPVHTSLSPRCHPCEYRIS